MAAGRLCIKDKSETGEEKTQGFKGKKLVGVLLRGLLLCDRKRERGAPISSSNW